jgi:putative peptide zinc metalloprotease protein
MTSIEVGRVAPSFRLPSGQGPEIGPDDYRGRRNVVVWFTKGMGCPFCRQHMTQIVRGYPSFQALNAEVLEVTSTPPERGRLYVGKFNIPFPYLCDPEYRVCRSWGLGKRSHSLGWYARVLLAGTKIEPPPNDFGQVTPSLGEFPGMLADDDMGFFILDKSGVVRYSLAGSYSVGGVTRQIPSNEEIVRELRLCEDAGA